MIALLNAVPSLLTVRGALDFLGYDDRQRPLAFNSGASDASNQHENHNDNEKADLGPLLAALAERPKRRLQLGTNRQNPTTSSNVDGDGLLDDNMVQKMPRFS